MLRRRDNLANMQRSIPRMLGDALLYLATVSLLAAGTGAAVALALLAVPHLIPADFSYGDEIVREDRAAQGIDIITSCVATPAGLAIAARFLARRRISTDRRPKLAPLATGLTVAAFAFVVLFALGPRGETQAALWLAIVNIIWFFVMRLLERGLVSGRALAASVLAIAGVIAVIGAYDLYSTDTLPRTRDRGKVSMLRYLGGHWARKGQYWNTLPPETMSAEANYIGIEYHPVDARHYRVCARFETGVSNDIRFPHHPGHTCYVMDFADAY